MDQVFKQGEKDLDPNEPDDDPLESGGVIMVNFFAKHLIKLTDHFELLIENISTVLDI